jgi:membrane associated rhomboid family serine protease
MSNGRTYRLDEALKLSALPVCALYLIQGMDLLFRLGLNRFGIVPRTEWGLIGVIFSPLLHASFSHVIANSVPLFVLLLVLFSDRRYYAAKTLALIWVASGLGTWIIGRGGSVHIGASSIVFGLIVYLIVAGLLMGSWRAAIIAVLVFLLFGVSLLGVLPHAGPISWEGHLCGAAAGLWAARWNHA